MVGKLGVAPKVSKKDVRAYAHKQALETLRKSIPDAFPYDAHAFLCAVYMNPEYPLPRRIEAAKAALSYEKPTLASVKQEISGVDGAPLEAPTLIIQSSGV